MFPDLDFEKIKTTAKLTDVLARYKIALRFKGDYAVCVCPLPTHKKDDSSKSFSINLAGNYWRCFSDSCNANNGGRRGGDVINFVALMEGCKEKEAALKLAIWYGKEKAPTHTEQGRKQNKQNAIEKNTSSAVAVNYMASIDLWFNETFERLPEEDEESFWSRVRKATKSKLVESYKAGQKSV
jgi:DNA primase